MGIFGTNQRKRSGFTIVELLIVIVVIGILASIVMVAYPGYQQRTRDNERKSDVSQFAAAFKAYALQKNDYMESTSNCGFMGQGNGWINAGPNAFFPNTISSCLKTAKVLTQDIIDPSGCLSDTGGKCGTASSTPTSAYMKATCTKSGNKITYIFAYLEGSPRIDAQIDALCDAGSVTGFSSATQKWGSVYGMNYYVAVQ
jgi:prepilin-type N-terminal cleavage/methylation domain-containing protein